MKKLGESALKTTCTIIRVSSLGHPSLATGSSFRISNETNPGVSSLLIDQWVKEMPSFPVPQGRRSKRVLSKGPASLVINLDRNQKRLPCLVLDSSKEGFRMRGNFRLKRRQVVEIILDGDPLNSVRCSVVWIGKAGSKQEGEVGLEAV